MRLTPFLCAFVAALAGCTTEPGPDDGGSPLDAAPAADWTNTTYSGTAYALATPNGWAIDPRDAPPHTFTVPEGAAWLEVVVQAAAGGIGYVLSEPECQGQPTAPTAPTGCEHRSGAASGPADSRLVDPKPGTWMLDIVPPAGTPTGPWQAEYVAAVGVQAAAR